MNILWAPETEDIEVSKVFNLKKIFYLWIHVRFLVLKHKHKLFVPKCYGHKYIKTVFAPPIKIIILQCFEFGGIKSILGKINLWIK